MIYMAILFFKEEKQLNNDALKYHENGKVAIQSRVELDNQAQLALAYTPGVAVPCLEIEKNPEDVYKYTSKGHMVAIVSDGTAVLGLGDIGPEAAIPVMEGKALLLKKFADVDAFPICLATKDPSKIVETVKIISPVFGGIILEDISAPRCVEIERKLKSSLDIPVFHDDQHGTAIVVGAGLLNASRVVNKPLEEMRVVVLGAGASGSAVMRIIKGLGVKTINAVNRRGGISLDNYYKYDFVIRELIDEKIVTPVAMGTPVAELLEGADVFIGLSGPNLVTEEMVQSMNENAIVFALANPTPEIMPDVAKRAGAKVVATGRSDFPNQINNVLAFPGIFKGALAARAKQITEEMKLVAARAIASLITDDELNPDNIIPSAFDSRVVDTVSKAIIAEAKRN